MVSHIDIEISIFMIDINEHKEVARVQDTRYKIQDTFICHKITHTHIYLHY